MIHLSGTCTAEEGALNNCSFDPYLHWTTATFWVNTHILKNLRALGDPKGKDNVVMQTIC